VFGALAARPSQASNIIVGVNSWYTPPNLSQEEMVKQLAESGVRTIRISLLPNSVDFVIKAYRHGTGPDVTRVSGTSGITAG
jgi:hypothetical protein